MRCVATLPCPASFESATAGRGSRDRSRGMAPTKHKGSNAGTVLQKHLNESNLEDESSKAWNPTRSHSRAACKNTPLSVQDGLENLSGEESKDSGTLQRAPQSSATAEPEHVGAVPACRPDRDDPRTHRAFIVRSPLPVSAGSAERLGAQNLGGARTTLPRHCHCTR